MVTAYFDATYNHFNPNRPEPLVHTVGSYIATRDNWRKFRKEWNIELGKKGLKYFHMTDFEFALSRVKAKNPIPEKNLFHGWTEDEFVPFLKRLHRTIARKSNGIYRLESISSNVVMSDFDETLPDELKGHPKCGSYYVFNAWTVMRGIALWANKHNYYDPIHYVFAGGDGEGNNIERLFVALWNYESDRHHYHLSKGYSHVPYSVEMMKGEPALQAADITAFESQKMALKWLESDCTEDPSDKLRKSLFSLAKAEHRGWLHRKKEVAETFTSILKEDELKRRLGVI